MNDERREAEALERIADDFDKLLVRLSGPAATGLSIQQDIGGLMGAIQGIIKGSTGVFTGVPVPAGSSITGVPTWSADDPNVSLTPSADGSSVAVATSTTDTASSFNLTQNAVSSNGNPITSGPVNVPLLPATPPPPVPATSMDVTQIS